MREFAYPRLLALNPTERSTPRRSNPRPEVDDSTALFADLPSAVATFVVMGGIVRGDDAGPRPLIAHPTSMPRLMDHNNVNAKTGVLISTFKTG